MERNANLAHKLSGLEVPLKQVSILPQNFSGDAQLTLAIVLAVTGFVLILLMEKLAVKK
jgi:hypothetical protein